MNFKDEFNKIMTAAPNIALATSVENTPNVRIVQFYYDTDTKRAYFTTFKGAAKIKDFEANSKVAFTTEAVDDGAVRVFDAQVRKSVLTAYDVKDKFSTKFPQFEMMLERAGDNLALYEIEFHEANVMAGFRNTDTITV